MKQFYRRSCHCIQYFIFCLQWILWIACYFWLIFILVPQLINNYVLNILLTLIIVAMMFSLFRNLFLSFWEASKSFVLDNSHITKAQKSLKKRCTICNTFKSEHIHHCSTCEHCIYKLDHHCFCLGRCVTYHTYPYFVAYVFVAWVTSVVYSALAVAFVWRFGLSPVSRMLMVG
eukprot:TRINITY_DN7507_c0_g1_i14.p2 TRINITY_DN7507_c0_g1~~TRINITY_DN7507_c0_g1_i14.p2  ORF type:complete len:174 (+),score=12.90 TRINITY_DN7507_c0_g1_i14:146-667(+)